MRIIDAYNASGLTFTLLPDRGLDIWTAHYKGIPLTWIAAGSPFPSDFGQSWLQQFNGGLLTTCGLTHVGPPETDEITGEVRDLHGRYNRLHADQVVKRWKDWPSPAVELSGIVRETAFFGEQIELARTYKLSFGLPRFSILDTITNRGDQPAPLMLLYHANVGFPLVREGAILETPHRAVHPRTDEARQGLDQWPLYAAPVAGYKEQVYFHHLMSDPTGEVTKVLLHNGQIGLELGWTISALPYFTQWKNTRQGLYVNGIEPGNCIPEGQNAARRNGRLQMLAPGETIQTHCRLRVVDGTEAIADAKNDIAIWRTNGKPTAIQLDDYPI